MNKKKIKVLVGIAIYLLIQIPVAILGMRGIYLQDVLKSRKEVVPLDVHLDLGIKQLYDYTTGRTFGELTILENDEDYMIVDIETDEIEGVDEVFKSAYSFPSLKIGKVKFSKIQHENQYYWVNEQNNTYLLMFRLEKDRYFDIPELIKKDESIMFCITEISDYMYNFHFIKKTSVPTKKGLLVSMYRSEFSAFFKN